MTGFDNDRLAQLRQQINRKKHLEAQLADLYGQRQTLGFTVSDLARAKEAEQADVDRLEGRSLAAFFYNVVGQRVERLAKERQEAYAAAVKYDAAAKELAAVEETIAALEAEHKTLEPSVRDYEEALAAKALYLKNTGSAQGERLLALEERIAWLDGQKTELGEAIQAGQAAQRTAREVLSGLEEAETWSTLDLVGGGLIFDLQKYSHLDAAQDRVETLQLELRRFKTELADVTIHAELQVTIEGFLRFADYFFDGLFADWAVLDQIGQAQAQVEATLDQIGSVLTRLEELLASAAGEHDRLKTELEQLIADA